MNRGLLIKSIRESWLSTLLFAVGLCACMAGLTAIIPQFQDGLEDMIQSMPFVQNMISAFLGIDVQEEFSIQMLQTFVWVHPINLALVWATAVVLCTRVPCGEIDRGTIDVLLGWPVSRKTIALTETSVWLVGGLIVNLFGLAGHLMMQPFAPSHLRAAPIEIARIHVNLYALYVAVACIAWLCSCVMERRNRAMGTVFAILLASFLINFVAQVWPPGERMAFLSVLQYYKPAEILRTDRWPTGDLITLLSLALIAWFAGTSIFCRRPIRTT